MNFACRAAIALVLTAAVWPTFAADYFWNCTTPDGIKYADASKCDKGDTAVKMMKGGTATSAPSSLVQSNLDEEKLAGMGTKVCPTNPNVCSQPDYGVTEGSPRAQAIAQFMHKKQCEFLSRFPQRCTKN